MLKGKWRKLKFLDVTNLDFLPATVVTACILHNLLLETEGEDEDYEPASDKSDEDEDEDEDFLDNDIEEEDNEGRIKRDRICASL